MTSPLPAHLGGTSASGAVPGEPLAQFEVGPGQNLVYLVADWSTRDCALVDPHEDIHAVLAAVRGHRLTLRAILLTHTHHDHVGGLWSVLAEHPDARVFAHPEDWHRVASDRRRTPAFTAVRDGDHIPVGGHTVEVLHTPGHSRGECCFLLRHSHPPYLMSGDTLFIRDCGRTDLETGSTREMFHSLQRLKALPPETVLLPGHHYATPVASRLSDELLHSPPLLARSEEELGALP